MTYNDNSEKNNKELIKKNNKLEKNIKELTKRINELEKNNKEIQKKLDDEIKEGDKLYEQNEELKKNETENNKKIKELENQISKINKELNEGKKYNDELLEENKNLKQSQKNNENNYQINKKDSLSRINTLEKDNKSLSKEIEKQKQEYLDKIKELEIKLNEKEKIKKNDENKSNKQINDKILFLENIEDELESEMNKIKIKEKDIEKIKKQLEEEKNKINNNSNSNNNNINNNVNNSNNINFNMNNNMNLNNMSLNNYNMNSMNNMMNNISPMNINLNLSQAPSIGNMININNNNPNIINNNMNNFVTNYNFNNGNGFNRNKDLSKPINQYSKPTLIGLNNIGATCYMNSTLQCLSQTVALTNYFLNDKNKEKIINNNIAKEDKNALQLCPAYLELIQNLWSENPTMKSYSPNNFMKTIESMNSLFVKGQAGDSKDFIIFILEQIHSELKKPVKNYKPINLPLNQYDKDNAFKNFFNEFQAEVSVISDSFFGFNETANICLYCRNFYANKRQNFPICYNYGIFNVLIFPLEEVRKMRYGMNSNNNIVNLYDCFQFNQKTDLFTGDNKNYCNICKQLWDSEYTSRIYLSPNILILILNRGKDNMYKVKIDFGESLDITQYVSFQTGQRQLYSLYGVITHIGQSGPYAHFVASCKSPIDGYWYRYNDALVSPINDFKKDIYNLGNPYILFYQKCN